MKKIFSILLLSTSLLSYGGVWTLPKGKSYTQLSYTYLQYSHLRNGRLAEMWDLRRNMTDYTFVLYNEYGISDKLNLITSIPIKYVASSMEYNDVQNDGFIGLDTLPSGQKLGVSNIRLGLKYNFINKKYLVTGELKYVSKGLGKTFDYPSGLRTAIDAWGLSPTIHIGRGFKNKYFTWETGYLYHSNNFNDQFISDMELGFNIGKKKTAWFAMMFNVYLPVTNESFDNQTANQTVLYNNELAYYSPGFKFIQAIKKNYYVNLSFNGAIRSQRGVGSPTVTIGFAYKPSNG